MGDKASCVSMSTQKATPTKWGGSKKVTGSKNGAEANAVSRRTPNYSYRAIKFRIRRILDVPKRSQNGVVKNRHSGHDDDDGFLVW